MQFLFLETFVFILQRANVLVVTAAFLYGTPRKAIEEKHVVKVCYHQNLSMLVHYLKCIYLEL
jgi:hypothetical protein